MPSDLHSASETASVDASVLGDVDTGRADWPERVITAVAMVLGVLIVAAVAVVLGVG